MVRLALRGKAMICDRCGEVAETYMTEERGEIREDCQREIQRENRRQFGRARSQGQDG